ncbi:hypothetical protein JAAARDRAFT_31777 [Jaapia argillacea MUCL 33604]|uniref:Dolichol phosphate-mannose biosynthesis regulatory protein n=1 Tax=Jaapia argillacea MUCL 33604 TaxID=933084 RepID=A0A067QBA6_9AGAM|nr:hypothetical protein JAAARDRAFT_31777 [Jaapia argillacea MUCL 33604]
MGTSDKVLGGSMLLTAAVVFIYYTTWAILLPFFEPSSLVHQMFPPREWAVRLPALILVLGLTAIGIFIGSTIVKENRRKALKARQRDA